MRYGIIGSIIIHLVVLGLVVFNFLGGSSKPLDTPSAPAVSVEVTNLQDHSEHRDGKADGKIDKPLINSEKKAPDLSAVAKKPVDPKDVTKPAEKEKLAPPKPAETASIPPVKKQETKQETAKAEQEKAAEAQTEKAHEKAVEKTPPKPQPKKEAEHTPKTEDPKKQADAKKTAPQHNFDAHRIEALLHKGSQQDQQQQQSSSSASMIHSKVTSDQQTAVLDRDPNAGNQGGHYQQGQPWRPASSLEDQAKGLQGAQGQVNAEGDAEFLMAQIRPYFDLPIGSQGAENVVVTVHFQLAPDGRVMGAPQIVNTSSSPAFVAIAEAAKRAILRAQPFKFPPGQYEKFRDDEIDFDPREMYGAAHG